MASTEEPIWGLSQPRDYTFTDVGFLRLTVQIVEIGELRYRMIADAEIDGPPLVLVGDSTLAMLPDWAMSLDGELVQIGPLVLRSIDVRHYPTMSTYYCLVDSGEVYALWWWLCARLDSLWQRMILTLALWGFAEWPRDGDVPTWNDVKRKWKHD